MIHDLYKQGKSIREIGRLLKMDPRTVSKHLKEVNYSRTSRVVVHSILEPYKKIIFVSLVVKVSTAYHT